MDKTTTYVLVGLVALVGGYFLLTRTSSGAQLATTLGLSNYLPHSNGVASAGITAGASVVNKGIDYLISRDKNATAIEVAKLENSSDDEDE